MVGNYNTKDRKPFLKSILTLLTGTTIAQAIPIAISPILTRIYTPEDFGLLALYLSIFSIFVVSITARYELAIMLPKEDKEAVNLVVLSIIIATGISIVILLIVILWGSNIASMLGNDDIYPWLYFMPLSLFLSGLYQAFNYWSNRKQQYQRLAVNRVAQSTTNASINLAVGSEKEGAIGLIAGNIISQFIATASLVLRSIKKDKLKISSVSKKEMIYLAKRYDQFPKVSVWSGLLNTVSVQLPVFIISAFFSSTIVGFYSLSNRVLNMPMSILGNAVGQVFFSSIFKFKI
ncbi:oligosaccharide flippase family protein [Psychrobacillus sp. NEAU-3TGS]|uniref:lipopolysaccharide biosynthesis protein n=1 Tax=Psychrobacillus sp. NEAU-3TGS TaxID=2995412 RepID=UPI0024991E06|nr:oligosaccharide flippase family protein [Psychrobacillus sp. NEAU-3TGS]MDI2587664.1 oligosaccharide flippase family protein [Psychrobacillus sp. NEAU-3TGS]